MGSKGCSSSGTLIPSVKLAKSTSRIDTDASLNANAKLSLRGFTICPYQAEINMGKQRNKACGADIHRNKIAATILSSSGTKNQAEFGTTLPELLRFKAWLIHDDCDIVAMESTGTYWIPVYSILEGSIEVIVANPYMIKHIAGKKTDLIDADWLAELCLKDLIVPSRIFSKEDRTLRCLTRAREGLVKIRTQLKNRIHSNQSADKLHTGCITKHGSKHLRWIMIQIAHAASKKNGSKLRKFYLRIRARTGDNVAIVALARKILCILHHLLMNQEVYEELGGAKKTKSVKLDQLSSQKELTAQEMVDVLRLSG
jgi:hypothetical protein